MDDILPTYESATEKTPWKFVAPYLSSNDLCSAALVCRKWHDAFAPQLWGSPTSYFPHRSYPLLLRDKFQCFRRTLLYARLHIRELTHTLCFPPILSESDALDEYWLGDVLFYLPNLQSLIVHQLSWFDHASLKALSSPRCAVQQRQGRPTYALRLLDASNCPNVTASGLAEALQYLPELVVLDLSGTNAVTYEISWLHKLETLSNLRVLSLRGMNLRYNALLILAKSIGTRVRSLDLRDNRLVNQAIDLLVAYCLSDVESRHPGISEPDRESKLPADSDVSGNEQHLDTYLRKMLSRGFAGHLATDEAAPVGITHLYLSGNPIGPDKLPELLLTRRLRVLDVGGLPLPYDSYADSMAHAFVLPGIEMLTPVIERYAQDRLTYLRINHGIVTKEVSSYTDSYLDKNVDMKKAGCLDTTDRSIDEVEHRQRVMGEQQAKDLHLHPAMLPRLRTLVLTDVPLMTHNENVVPRIIQLIKDCAEETKMAKLRAKSAYALPPGRSRPVAEREYARGLFALRRIVLEMAHQPVKGQDHDSSRSLRSGSYTGDADADAFWKTSGQDFSFFGEEERGVSGEVHRPTPPPDHKSLRIHTEKAPTKYDVLYEISTFRKSRKAAYVAGVASGNAEPDIAGHWPGEITVIRKDFQG